MISPPSTGINGECSSQRSGGRLVTSTRSTGLSSNQTLHIAWRYAEYSSNLTIYLLYLSKSSFHAIKVIFCSAILQKYEYKSTLFYYCVYLGCTLGVDISLSTVVFRNPAPYILTVLEAIFIPK